MCFVVSFCLNFYAKWHPKSTSQIVQNPVMAVSGPQVGSGMVLSGFVEAPEPPVTNFGIIYHVRWKVLLWYSVHAFQTLGFVLPPKWSWFNVWIIGLHTWSRSVDHMHTWMTPPQVVWIIAVVVWILLQLPPRFWCLGYPMFLLVFSFRGGVDHSERYLAMCFERSRPL